MKVYTAHCDHCGWHHETTKLVDHNWITSDPYAHCRRVERRGEYEREDEPALFDLESQDSQAGERA